MHFSWVSCALGAVGLLLSFSGCGDDCSKELHTSVKYSGLRAGRFYSRTVVDGRVSSGGSGFVSPDGGIGMTGGSSEGCYPDDAQGGHVEGWLDLDGDDTQRCACASPGFFCSAFEPSCEPEPGDPQGKQTFALKHGLTTADLMISDQ